MHVITQVPLDFVRPDGLGTRSNVLATGTLPGCSLGRFRRNGGSMSSSCMFSFIATGVLAASALVAQTPGGTTAAAIPAEPSAAKPDLPTLQEAARAAESKLPTTEVKLKTYFDLAPEQRVRWQEFLPQTLIKLTRRDSVQIVVLGDAILDGVKPDEDGEDPLLQSFAGVFAKALANQFYYTGGVRVLRPDARPRENDSRVLGPEILLQPVQTESIVSAQAALSTTGLRGRPDLVLVAYGLQDGMRGTSAADMLTALRGLLEATRKHQLEMIIAGPVPQAADPEETSLALTGTASSVMREFAASEKVLFADLGDLSRLVVPPSGTQEAHLLFPALVQQYQSRLNSVPVGAVATPTAAMHETMGRILFHDVMQGAPPVAWRVSAPSAVLRGKGALDLGFEITNQRQQELALTVLPLDPPGYDLKETQAEIKLAAGGKHSMKALYTVTNPRFLPIKDGKVRLPVLVIAGAEARIHDLAAPLKPFSVTWGARVGFNQETEFSPDLEIENSSGAKLAGSWEAQWNGRKQGGKLALDADGSEGLPVKLTLPTDDKAPRRQRLPLSLAVEAGGVRQVFDRHLELVRNFGLKETVPLTGSDGRESPVTLRVEADGTKLFLTLDLTAVQLADNESGRAFELLLNLDARSYGKRQTSGATAALRITGKAADGAAQVGEIEPWAFGTGYAAVFKPDEITAVLSSAAAGSRRLTITLPKSYLYLHEWALGNGNSQMGINVRFHGGGLACSLTHGVREADDAESLAVLELTDKPTRRWTVRVE